MFLPLAYMHEGDRKMGSPAKRQAKRSRTEAVLKAGIDPKTKQIHARTYGTVRCATRVLGNLMHKIDTGDR